MEYTSLQCYRGCDCWTDSRTAELSRHFGNLLTELPPQTVGVLPGETRCVVPGVSVLLSVCAAAFSENRQDVKCNLLRVVFGFLLLPKDLGSFFITNKVYRMCFLNF